MQSCRYTREKQENQTTEDHHKRKINIVTRQESVKKKKIKKQ